MRPKRLVVYIAAVVISLWGLSLLMGNALVNFGPGGTIWLFVGGLLGVIVILVVARRIAHRWDPGAD